MSPIAETTAYDPRFDRAQTVDGATARYVAHDTDYDLKDFERDVARLLTGDSYPDATPKQDATREFFTERV